MIAKPPIPARIRTKLTLYTEACCEYGREPSETTMTWVVETRIQLERAIARALQGDSDTD